MQCSNCIYKRRLGELTRENKALKAKVEKQNQRLVKMEKQFAKRISQLEAELRKAKKQAVPFARDKSSLHPKPPGRKPGRGRFSRREEPSEEEITRTVTVPLSRCPECGGPLEDKQTHTHLQSDVPEIKIEHTRYLNESGWCPHCKKRVRSRHPEQASTAGGAAGISIGPRAKSLAVNAHHRLGVPFAKTAELLQDAFGLQVTPAALCQTGARLAEKARPLYEALVGAVRRACAVNADETGWRIGPLKAWLWVFTNQEATVYAIENSRGHEVVINILGHDFKGALVSDCFLAYDHKDLAAWIKQKCLGHLLKDLSLMEAEKIAGAVRFPRQVTKLLRQALKLRDAKDQLTPRTFRRRRNRLDQELDKLISEERRFTDPDNARFAARLRKQRQHLFTFLDRPGVDATNNRAERGIRPGVISRKTGACNKTRRGADTHSILMSVLVSAKQRGRNPSVVVSKILTSSGRLTPLLGLPSPCT